MSIIRIFMLVLILPVIGIAAICGHIRARRLYESLKSIALFRFSVLVGKLVTPQDFFVFEGIDCVVDPKALGIVGAVVMEGEFSAAIISLGFSRALIIVSQRPNLNDPSDLAILWHEVGHAVNGDLPKIRKHYLETGVLGVVFQDFEIAADAYAAARVGAEAMINALEVLVIAVPVGEYRDLVEDRISVLERRNQEEG